MEKDFRSLKTLQQKGLLATNFFVAKNLEIVAVYISRRKKIVAMIVAVGMSCLILCDNLLKFVANSGDKPKNCRLYHFCR